MFQAHALQAVQAATGTRTTSSSSTIKTGPDVQGEASAGRGTLERSVAGDPGAARTACTSSARASLPLAGKAESTS